MEDAERIAELAAGGVVDGVDLRPVNGDLENPAAPLDFYVFVRLRHVYLSAFIQRMSVDRYNTHGSVKHKASPWIVS